MVGDLTELVARLRSVLPKGWFSDQSPNLTAILSCFAIPFSWLYSLINYVQVQTRIGSATDSWLDLAAQDFFGRRNYRKIGESDAAFQTRIKKTILAAAGTRPALISGILELSGSEPTIFESGSCQDTGAYGFIGKGPTAPSFGFAYGVAGGWGSLQLPYQIFLTVKRPAVNGESGLAGYGTGAAGYGVGATAYLDLLDMPGYVTDKDIEAKICSLLPLNAVAWLRII